MAELHIAIKKKDKDLADYKKMVEKLELMFEERQVQISKLATTIQELSILRKNEISALQSKLDKITTQADTQEWVVSFDKLKKYKQFSKQFYSVYTPFCFQLSARVENDELGVWIHRCRGGNDNRSGKIVCSSFVNFNFVFYVVGPDGLTKSRHCNADNENFLEGLYINSGSNRSVGYGFATFFESTKVEWNEWVINKKLHLFLRIEPNFLSGNS